MSDSLWPHGLKPAWLLCPWDFPCKDTGVGCHFLLQGIFSTQGLSSSLLHLLHCKRILPYHATCGILVPRPGIKPTLPALEAGSLNHWTAGEVPQKVSFLNNSSEACISKKKKKDCISKKSCSLPSLIFLLQFFLIKIFFFWCGSFLKSLLNLLQYCFCCFCSGLLAPRHLGS